MRRSAQTYLISDLDRTPDVTAAGTVLHRPVLEADPRNTATMPTLISRDEALRRIRSEGGRPECLMCSIIDRQVGVVHVIYEDATSLVMLPRYVRRWGHVMIVPKAHVLNFADASPELWAETSGLAHRAARIVEAVMRPRRCYMASTGSSAGELTQTSRHLHVHVIPLYSAEDRPSDIFSWTAGVYVGDPHEWATLRQRYVDAWSRIA